VWVFGCCSTKPKQIKSKQKFRGWEGGNKNKNKNKKGEKRRAVE
jgi:hypothetical protein